ncbi:MAG: hypothetical protein MUD12_14110 [Spirochaetes bacterium]|jgi:hypothetical protein|nr:hypothetical protein [Spirochaetota bacterium]
MEDQAKKKLKLIAAVFLVSVFFTLCILTILSLSAKPGFILKNKSGSYRSAGSLMIFGGIAIGLMDPAVYNTKKEAVESAGGNFTPRAAFLDNVAEIEIIQVSDAKDSGLPGNVLGVYQINATGHKGYLYLNRKDGSLFGYVRFPGWAKGSYEPLKKLYISGDKISFTRSVYTREELKKVGSPGYFRQDYQGNFQNNGSAIKGFYIKDGGRYLWDAKRLPGKQ